MRLHILSDLHLEFKTLTIPTTAADVVILAGDVHVGSQGLDWIKRTFPDQPVVYVLGNHEYYRHALPELTETLQREVEGTNIHVLENSSYEWNGFTILGCCLWTSFLVGPDPEAAMRTAETLMNDYPSPALASLHDPVSSLNGGLSLSQLRKELRSRIAERIDQAGLHTYETGKGSPERWYWAAPLLLDRADKSCTSIVGQWLNDQKLEESSSFLQSQDGEQSGKRRHFAALRDAFMNPDQITLGRMPDDLPDVLADMALGSPAITALRTLQRLFPSANGKLTKYHLRGGFEIAGEFLNLFNKPESICAVRLTCPPADYWRQVLCYCADGCLQAVLDEYGHLTKDQKRSMEATIARLRETVNITATSVNVDSLTSFIRGRSHKMRCHYAVEFGNQKLETDVGQQRATSIRENFNSPFRPFVLATTSIGQEGLDFHQYCRKIVHWNLPGNPIDLEQREGRINRYKGLVIRQEVARKYGAKLTTSNGLADPWVALFGLADFTEREQRGKCELVPYWHVESDHFKIERIIPLYPFSRDRGKLTTILKTLAIYRLAFGQPRQVELIEHLLQKNFTQEEIEAIRTHLLIDLSPSNYRRRTTDHAGTNPKPEMRAQLPTGN